MTAQTDIAAKKTTIAMEKAERAITELSRKNMSINFNSVAKLSGVSSTFLYRNKTIRQKIELLRDQSQNKIMPICDTNTDNDQVKDKHIKDLEAENETLKKQIEDLKKKLYILYM